MVKGGTRTTQKKATRKGRIIKNDQYQKQAMQAVRFAGVLITPILAVYSILVVIGIIPSTHYINPEITLAIAAAWLLVSFYYFMSVVQTPAILALRIGVFHAFAFVMFAFSTGFAQPLAPLFVLLFLAAHIYFGRKGLLISIASFVLFVLTDSVLNSNDPAIVQNNIVASVIVLVLSVALLGIVSAQETRRRALMHSQERERMQYDRILTIINNLTDATFSVNEKGSIQMYNAAALDLLDTNDSLKSKNINDVLTLTDSDKNKIVFTDLLKGLTRAVRRDDLDHTYADGESVRLEITTAPIRTSYSVSRKKEVSGGYIVIMRDVTKQKSLEEERDEFISVVSHELRTPITIVEGTLSNLDFMLKQPKAPAQDVLASSIETAHEQVLYLAKMVNDLSTLSRAERGVADEPESIVVEDLLHDMHHRYQAEAKNKGLHLDVDLGTRLGSVNVSRLYLEELLQNFITNAIKYTKEGSVTIIGRRTGNTVSFAVQDTGMGISRGDQTRIFEKFYRSEDYRIRETGGTGLGLYVSSKLARKLRTQINLKSRLNHGSTFSFELPTETHAK